MSQNWFQHALRKATWRSQTQIVTLVVMFLIVAMLIGALYLAQVTTTVTTQRDIESLELLHDRIERDSERIRAEIAEWKAIPRLMARAQSMGFRPATDETIAYLQVDGYIEVVPETVAEIESQPLPEYDETFDGWLEEQWEALRRQFEEWMEGGAS